MSAIRVPGPDGRTILVVIDDGAVGRVSFTRYGLRGGTVYGTLPTGESKKERQRRFAREHKARQAQ